jgi:hypothetical protein
MATGKKAKIVCNPRILVSADYHTFISDDHHAFIYHKKTGLTLSRFLTVNRVIPLRVMSMDCSSLYVLTVFSVPI